MNRKNRESLNEFTRKVFRELDDAGVVIRRTAEFFANKPKHRNVVRTILDIKCPECGYSHSLTEEYWGEFEESFPFTIHCNCGCTFRIKIKEEDLQ